MIFLKLLFSIFIFIISKFTVIGNIEIIYPDESMTKAALKLIFQNTGYDLNIDQALTNIIAYRAQVLQICSFEYSSFYFGIRLFELPF